MSKPKQCSLTTKISFSKNENKKPPNRIALILAGVLLTAALGYNWMTGEPISGFNFIIASNNAILLMHHLIA